MLERALQELLEAAAEAGARRALEQAAPEARCSMIPIKQAPVAYRALLDAERAGELRIYRKGKASLVDVAELEAWIRRAPRAADAPAPADEAGELIAFNRERRTKPRTKRLARG